MINFEATLKALSDSGVNFVVIGGYAATLHGSAYLTRDLHICYERIPENIEQLVASCATHVFPNSSEKVPKKAMSLLKVSTCIHKPAAALSVVFGLRHA